MAERRSPLLEAHRFLRRGPVNADGWSQLVAKDRDRERSYRGRWAHDKVVRSTHGVNCTGSSSWNVYVKDGLITWEAQAVDYLSTDPEMPEYEPRGCPRGASFSWYEYSPLRIKYPYVRGSLLRLFREARRRLGDPVEAWAEIVDEPQKSRVYRRQRGKGGFVRASWDEVVELIAAAHVHTIHRFAPDRCVGFTPIPAMSMASYASGTRLGLSARRPLWPSGAPKTLTETKRDATVAHGRGAVFDRAGPTPALATEIIEAQLSGSSKVEERSHGGQDHTRASRRPRRGLPPIWRFGAVRGDHRGPRGPGHEHYRVRWEDGRESIHYPSDGTKVVLAGRLAGMA
jgi:hypothetical protein